MSNSNVGIFPNKIQSFLGIALTIVLVGSLLLIYIEGMNPVDAFYFLVVTISTVGYGDVTPTKQISKIIVIIIIITGLSSIAILVDRLVDRIVKLSNLRYLDLPSQQLAYEHHIVIVGFTKIAENIAMLFQGRFFRIVVIDPHEVSVERARSYGFEAYYGNPVLKDTLERLNIKKASALYLFMNDENKNVLTSIQSRNLSKELLIYAETEHELSTEIGNLIGIDRTYHYERIVASNIPFSLRSISALIVPKQTLSRDANFILILVSHSYPYKEIFSTTYPLGHVERSFTSFLPLSAISMEDSLKQGNFLVLAILREDFERSNLESDLMVVDEE